MPLQKPAPFEAADLVKQYPELQAALSKMDLVTSYESAEADDDYENKLKEAAQALRFAILVLVKAEVEPAKVTRLLRTLSFTEEYEGRFWKESAIELDEKMGDPEKNPAFNETDSIFWRTAVYLAMKTIDLEEIAPKSPDISSPTVQLRLIEGGNTP